MKKTKIFKIKQFTTPLYSDKDENIPDSIMNTSDFRAVSGAFSQD